MWEGKGACGVSVERPLARPNRRWGDNIKIDLQEIRWGGMGGIDLTQNREKCPVAVNMVMNLRFTQNAGNFLTC
jgi:hypothetical protein